MSQQERPYLAQRPDRRGLWRILLGLGLAGLATAACSGSGAQQQRRDPNRKPFWFREEQRDD